ncbi:MAG: translation initiation factor IF-3 [Candidatus Marinimicrobia bacterium]|nr:translation initiation factor IF-3 [Candidatus Neomarinimicrobiota bacterium]
MAKKNNRNKYRVNSQIVCNEVRLIDNNNEQRGLLNLEKAQEIANNVGLDLVEISPNSNPPVCKILDYGKFLYEIEKQDKLNKKKQHVVQVKEIRIRPNTGDHDLVTKLKRGQKFLENGDKLKITVMYRGREFYSRKEDGIETLNKVVEVLKDISFIDKPVDLQGRRVSIVLSPK